ncbi:serine/threonine-protein kinase [Streptomyces sp. NPDC048172]|uniref:serine/threonine-protein kinase n=1 Tax=Streptomyces sp. NPDC048172 TaxID=3365505 RepID=UPI00371F1E35
MEPLRDSDPAWIGAYRLLGRLGTGGMGRVYLARSARGRTVAVKLVQRELAEQEEFRGRFRHEVNAARRVGGQWTAPVLDADTEAEIPWVATGYIAGPTLRQVVGHEHGPLPERSLRHLATGLAEALRAIHDAGLVHRDLKPSNVLVTIDGPRVIDFGIARALEASAAGGLTRTGSSVGSPGFMSPEQVRGDRVTAASDVFCLGSVLAYAATGRSPFGSGDSGVHVLLYRITQEEPDLDGVPDALRPLIASCLAKTPEDRPSLDAVLNFTGEGDADPEGETEGGGEGEGEGRREAEDTSAAARTGVEADGRSWLPEALVAQLGRHAVRLLDTENPDDAPRTPAPAPGSSEAVTEIGTPADGLEKTAERTTVDGAPTGPPTPPETSAGAVGGTGGGTTGTNGSAGADGAAGADGVHGMPTMVGAPSPHPQPPPSPHGYGYGYPHAQPPPPAPEPPRRNGVPVAVILVTLVALLAGAGTALLVVRGQDNGDNDGDNKAQDKKSNSSQNSATESSGNPSSTSPSGGDIQDRFLGSWRSALPGKPDHTRSMVIRQADPGETAMTLSADGPDYHCEFEAKLTSAGDTVKLAATTVTVGAGSESCSPGQPTTLVPVGTDQIRRDNSDGTAPLTYSRG